jgi:hypothetical protein
VAAVPAPPMTTVEPKHGSVLAPLVLSLVLFHLFVLSFTLTSGQLFGGFFNERAYYGNFHWPREQPPTGATRFATWDGQHYLFLATEGYHAGQRSITFFPLFPWLIRATAALPGVGPLSAALLLANLLSIVACLLLWRLFELRHPGSGADTLLLLLAFPGALFFYFPYTESLFLFLAAATVLAVVQQRWLAAAVPALLLALTRPNGVLIAVVLAHAAIARWREDRKLSLGPAIALAAPALGFAVYLLFMRAATGNPMAGFAMQDAYNAGRSLGNFLRPLAVLSELVDARTIHGVLYSALDRAVFLFAIVTLVPLWRWDRTLFWYALPMAVVGPLSGSFVSYTRFAAVLFPCHLVVARLLGTAKRRPFLWLVIGVWYATQWILLLRHINFYWAG